MDKLKYIIILGAALLALSGCKCKQITKTEVVTKDSLVVKDSIVIRDRIYYSPVDTARIKALVICPDGKPANIKPIHARGKNQATVIFEIKDGVASVTGICDTAGIRVQERERYKTLFKQQLNSMKNEETIREPYVPIFFWVMTVIGIAAIIYGAFKLIYFFK